MFKRIVEKIRKLLRPKKDGKFWTQDILRHIKQNFTKLSKRKQKKKKILINQNAFNPILRVKLLNHYEIIVVSEIDMRYDNINTTIK